MKTKEDIIFEQVGLEGTLKHIGCYDAVLKAMTDFAKQIQTKNCNIHDVMCCSFCKEEIKFGEHEYMHKEGCGCMDEPKQTDEEFERLDTGHTVTNGYPLE